MIARIDLIKGSPKVFEIRFQVGKEWKDPYRPSKRSAET
jgi:hypothetical protein